MEDRKVINLINVAIEREEEAHDFYMDLYEKVEDKTAKHALQLLAKEEIKHKEFLEKYRDGELGEDALAFRDVVDYKIAEHLEEPDIEKNMASKEVYLVAAHRELLSYKFYTALADLHRNGEIKDMFLKMANEELKHKEKVEYLYSNTAFPQTAGG